MARWRLTNKHYLKVPGTEYEYKETNEETGRQARKVFEVPLFIDPENRREWNHPGGVFVAHVGKGIPGDIIFEGPPTLDMAPVDEEAEAITAEMQKGWTHQFFEVEEGYNGKMIVQIADALTSIKASSKPSSPTADQSSEIDQLKAQIAALTTLVEADKVERAEHRSARR